MAWDASKRGKKCHNIFPEEGVGLASRIEGGEVDVTRDYHGNFNADLFEFRFEKLCRTLQTIHGPCLIHMDGARYHMRRRDRPPTGASTMAQIRAWLAGHGAPFDPADNKEALLARVPAEYMHPRLASMVIAERYGHKVLFTPPYHPELEPIEIIWAVIKNRIAEDPSNSMAELGTKLIDSCRLVTEKTWLGARKKTMAQEDAYWTTIEGDNALDEGTGDPLDGMEEADASTAATIDSLSEESLA